MAAFSPIDDPSAFFQSILYTGTNNSNAINGHGNSDMQPDWLVIKRRTSDNGWQNLDSTRGVTKITGWESNGNETTLSGRLSSFDTDGFTVTSSSGAYNSNGDQFVAYQWKANGGTVSNNTNGNITTSVQVNSTCGVSIGKYTGDGNSGATIGHGLGAIPDFFMVKGISGSGAKYWVVGCPRVMGNGTSNHMMLDQNWAEASNTTIWRNVAFSTTTVPMGTHQAINHVNSEYMFYAFREIQGFSKVGKYKGSGNADGIFNYCGFKPALVIIKNRDQAEPWVLFDNNRGSVEGHNVNDEKLTPNTADGENDNSQTGAHAYNMIDFLSNGFKCRSNNGATNANDKNFLFIAFADKPLVASNGTSPTAY